MLDRIPIAPMLLLRWLVSFFNIEYRLGDRTIHLSLIKVDMGAGADKKEKEDGNKEGP